MSVLSPTDEAHVTLVRTRSRVARDGVAVHWSDLMPSDRDSDLPVTTLLRTVLDCARTLPFAEALAVADSALRGGLIGPEELRSAADALNGPGRAWGRRVARSADGRAESGLESVLRGIFLIHRIKGFVPQYVIRDEDFSARVDLADERRRLIAEADSFEHHGHRQALVRDCERYDELVIRGWRVLRFAWEQVMFRPGWVAEVTRTAVARPGARRNDRRNAA
jgi:very-short-patch-repair endonuclease